MICNKVKRADDHLQSDMLFIIPLLYLMLLINGEIATIVLKKVNNEPQFWTQHCNTLAR